MFVHLYAPTADDARPLVLLSGGVDTGKMELNRLACLLARIGRFRVAAIDMPGTGESRMALTADAENIYQELLATLAPTGKKAVLGSASAVIGPQNWPCWGKLMQRSIWVDLRSCSSRVVPSPVPSPTACQASLPMPGDFPQRQTKKR
jgi:hypothetical protein